MMSCPVSAAWTCLVLSLYCTNHGPSCDAVLLGHITTAASLPGMENDFHLETPPQGQETTARRRRLPQPAPQHATSLTVEAFAACPSTLCHRGRRQHAAPHPAEETIDVGPRRTLQPPTRRSPPPRPMLPKNSRRHEPQHCRPSRATAFDRGTARSTRPRPPMVSATTGAQPTAPPRWPPKRQGHHQGGTGRGDMRPPTVPHRRHRCHPTSIGTSTTRRLAAPC
jgi:hypothetical protein